MRELLPVPGNIELEAMFADPAWRKLGEGDKTQDQIWLRYFSALTGRATNVIAVDRTLLIKEAVSHSIYTNIKS